MQIENPVCHDKGGSWDTALAPMLGPERIFSSALPVLLWLAGRVAVLNQGVTVKNFRIRALFVALTLFGAGVGGLTAAGLRDRNPIELQGELRTLEGQKTLFLQEQKNAAPDRSNKLKSSIQKLNGKIRQIRKELKSRGL